MARRFTLIARVWLVVGLSLIACSADDLELLPFSADAGGEDAAADGGEIDSGGVDSGSADTGMSDAGSYGPCLGDLDCAMCPPIPCPGGCPSGRCAAVCDTGGDCDTALSDGATGPRLQLDGTACGLAEEALTFVGGPSERCFVSAAAGVVELTCLEGECFFDCDGPCLVDCPGGNCQLTCSGGGCMFRECPLPVLDCTMPNTFACAPACAG